MISTREKLEYLRSLSQVPVEPEAIRLTERVIKSCERIYPPSLINGYDYQGLQVLKEERDPTFSFFQKVFPRVALTLVDSLGTKTEPQSIGTEELIMAFAGDAHLRTVVQTMSQISGSRSVSNYIQCLAMGGRRKDDFLFHASQIKFPLYPLSQPEDTNDGFLISHLGQPILFCKEEQIEVLNRFQKTQPKVSLLLDDSKGETLRLIRPFSVLRK